MAIDPPTVNEALLAESEDLVEVAQEMLAQYADGQFPNLARVATELVASGFRYADEFEPGLDLILDGLERLPRTGAGRSWSAEAAILGAGGTE